jgi:hypothetical protein
MPERLGRLRGSTRGTQHARSRSSRVPEQASWFAADHLLQHLFVKRQIGDYPAQRRILHLKLPQILTSDGIKPP